ncbi:MAG: hypothetical protein QG608_1825, partial [Actinomycetota bacterium]|nr:hypothetical protein [Actinomycetota bacterium]
GGARRCGRRCGPLDGSARSKDRIGFGNTGVVAAILVDLPFSGRPVARSVPARLWRGKDTAGRSEPALARDLKHVAGGRIVHVVADAAHHHPGVAALPTGITWTTRLAANATLLGPTPPRPGKRGRPRQKGAPPGTLTQSATRAPRRPVTVARSPSPATDRSTNVPLTDQRGQWYRPWQDLPVQLILLHDPSRYYDLALITTDLTTPAEQLLTQYTARAVERTLPFDLTTHTPVILWYTRHGNPTDDVTTHHTASP